MDPTNEARHLDLLALDALRAGEGSGEDRAHVAACGACRDALETLRSLQGAIAGEAAAERARLGPVPREIEATVLAAFRREAARAARRRAIPRAVPLAAAAALLLAALAGLFVAMREPARDRARLASRGEPSELGRRPPGTRRGERWDVDGDGRVNIADAYLLAVRVRRGGEIELRWDGNGDGVVDEADVDLVARESVSLARWGTP